MRHGKKTFKIGRTGSHRKALLANMLKSLIEEERITTTVAKGKELKRQADRLISLAKKNDLASRRSVISKLQLRYNSLTPKEARKAKEGDFGSYNLDRKVVTKLFNTIAPRFSTRQGGYTRLLKAGFRSGDQASTCVVEFVAE